MLSLIGGGLLTAIGCFVLLAQLDLLKVAGYHLWLDWLISIGLVLLYQGTFSGMIVGFSAGLALTMMFRIVRMTLGYKKYTLDRGWIYISPEDGS